MLGTQLFDPSTENSQSNEKARFKLTKRYLGYNYLNTSKKNNIKTGIIASGKNLINN